jgi:alpha-beta hydrolase superfamily lysophospholipase
MRWAVAMEEWIDNFWVFDVQKRPLTIIQGDSDQTVDFEYNLEAIREKFPHTRVVNIVGGRHQLVNESEQYREKVMSALKDWLWASSA